MKNGIKLLVLLLALAVLYVHFSPGEPSIDKNPQTVVIITVDRATPSPMSVIFRSEAAVGDYIGNANTGKFHKPDCPSVKQMKESNKVE